MTLFLHGLGHFHPENEVTNAFLEDLDIGTTEAWIEERVGIRSRRTTQASREGASKALSMGWRNWRCQWT